MPFDSLSRGDRWGDPWAPVCKSCQQPIGAGEPVETMKFDAGNAHQLEQLNGDYHADCAKPFMSLARAYRMLGQSYF